MGRVFDICEATGQWSELESCLEDEALARGMGEPTELFHLGGVLNVRHTVPCGDYTFDTEA